MKTASQSLDHSRFWTSCRTRDLDDLFLSLVFRPQRPLALQCVRQMQDPSFPCLRYVLSCDIHSQLFLSELQGHSAVFWSYDKDGR